jgi:enterochelin esterase-like enzyme
MFHGQAATNDQWIRLGLTTAADQLIKEEKIQPLIIVMPFEATWTPGPADSTFDEAVLNDVLPYVEKDYAICKARTCRRLGAFTGWKLGGIPGVCPSRPVRLDWRSQHAPVLW